MNKNTLGILGVILLILVVLFSLSRVSCRESFWDKDTQVIEVETK